MAFKTMFRRRPDATAPEPATIPVPRFSIDGWTLSGTPLAAVVARRLSPVDARELTTLLHGVAIGVDTPYTYDRAALLLERCGEHAAALSVCEAWGEHPASHWPEYAHQTKAVARHRARLRARLGYPDKVRG